MPMMINMARIHFLLIIAISIEVILAGDVIRDPRSIGISPTNNSASKEDTVSSDESYKQVIGGKSVQLLVGGHLKLHNVTTTTTSATPLSDFETLKMESAGAGKGKETKDDDDEEKKTLAQQVVEGKYGLIQKELFAKPSKRPGIISYVTNSEVPKDTKRNLGGLDPEEIWLAEDHLLVLRGGKFPEHNSKDDVNVNWPPIDDYKAPRRQVKIPVNPKVPPPFPVQLTENGPIEFIGPNGSTRAIPANFGPPYPPEGFVPGSGPFFPNTVGDTPFPLKSFAGNSSQGNGKISPPPFPVRARQQPLPNVSPEFIASLPPGAAYLPPPNNQTDFYDEDDPSIYYPPPYSFFYPKENSTNNVPPGPLVPGIILPPPPDFFSPFEKDERKNKTTTTEQTTQIHPTPVSILSPTSEHIEPIYIPDDTPDKIQINIPSTIDYENDIESVTTPIPTISHTTTPKSVEKNVYYSTEPVVPKYTPISEGRKKIKYLKPTVTTTPASYYDYSDNYYENNAVTQNSKPSYGPPTPEKLSRFRYNNALRTLVSTTAVPLRAYFTTSEEIETNSVTVLPKQGSRYRHGGGLLTTRASPKINTQSQPASYYYYEEDPAVTTVKNQLYQNYGGNIQTQSQQSNYYNTPKKPVQPEFVFINSKQQPYYNARQREQYSLLAQTVRPEVINSQIARLKEEIQSYLTTPKPIYPLYRQQDSRIPTPFQKPSTSNPVYEYSFQAANYQQQQNFKNSPLQNDNEDQFRPIVGYNIPYKQQLNPAVYQTTQSPLYVYNKHETNTVRPSQSSYQSTDSSEYEYDDDTRYPQVTPQTKKVTESPAVIRQYINVRPTPNPVNHAYYTTQDERLFDDRTKQYFNVFGQKIANGDKTESATQSLKNQIDVTSEKYNNDNSPVKNAVDYKNPRPTINPDSEFIPIRNQQYQHNKQPPISLSGDTDVNYKNPRPTINPDSEFIPIRNQQYQHNKQPPISLSGDTDVNYKNPRPTINPNSEFIPIRNQQYQQKKQPSFLLNGDTDVNYKNPRPTINPDSEFIPIRNQQYQQKQPKFASLSGDTNVNYKNPRPTINPNSEFISVGNREYQDISIGSDIPSAQYKNPSINIDSEFIPIVNRQYQQNHLSNPQGVSLESDIGVNYKNPRPAINPDAELINPNAEPYSINNQNEGQIEPFNKQVFKPNPNAESYEIYNIVQQRLPQNSRYLNHQYIQQRPVNYHRQNTREYENIRQSNNNVGEGRPGSFISYQLPGNGAHFYFLTPRVASPQQRQNQPISGYYYPTQEGSRLRRSRVRQQPTRSR